MLDSYTIGGANIVPDLFERKPARPNVVGFVLLALALYVLYKPRARDHSHFSDTSFNASEVSASFNVSFQYTLPGPAQLMSVSTPGTVFEPRFIVSELPHVSSTALSEAQSVFSASLLIPTPNLLDRVDVLETTSFLSGQLQIDGDIIVMEVIN